MIDASTQAASTTTPAKDWWKPGVAACPKGGSLDGAPPPKGNHVWCKRADGVEEGPEAWWDDKGNLLSIGARKEGRQEGGFVAFYPDGKNHRMGSYRAGNQTGKWTTWWPNGQVFLDESYVDGRADGTQTAYAQDGKVIETWKLSMGTGTMKWWDDDGHKSSETEYVDGRAQGASTSYWPSGKVQTKERFVEGEPDGVSQEFWESDGVREQETYRRGTQIGDSSSFDEHGAQTRLVRRDREGTELFEILFDGGKPLVPVPAVSRCDDKAGMMRAAGMHVSRGDEPECIERLRHFPGVAVVGSFAYDAGCMDPQWMIDCKKVDPAPDAKAILARAGWAKAKGPLREELASAYVDEVAMLWAGGTLEQPDPRKVVSGADGGVVVTAWTAPRAGMRPDPTITLVEWTFTPAGTVTEKTIKSSTRTF